MKRALCLALLLFLAAAPAVAAEAEEYPQPKLLHEAPKLNALPPSSRRLAAAWAIALSVATVPLRLAATLVTAPVYVFLKSSDAVTGKDEAGKFALKAVVGDYAVRPEHVTGDVPYRFMGVE